MSEGERAFDSFFSPGVFFGPFALQSICAQNAVLESRLQTEIVSVSSSSSPVT